eukprot:CAMPEP_0202783418 /NCGR_PEP_ID=MMETSP1388-20130828/64404_1 /ASSEMBLY_ACC=CAM_ASM_000864 /TAXON_ID=37098 /ORGANISM="Isochrysis sp, Strain CCMP1244" /LENGTH=168 /DNA_ID=CAMNT_0049452881 /DNA_START=133 /DNA_END=641 /DNA_ORIENTATION=+
MSRPARWGVCGRRAGVLGCSTALIHSTAPGLAQRARPAHAARQPSGRPARRQGQGKKASCRAPAARARSSPRRIPAVHPLAAQMPEVRRGDVEPSELLTGRCAESEGAEERRHDSTCEPSIESDPVAAYELSVSSGRGATVSKRVLELLFSRLELRRGSPVVELRTAA